MSFNKAKSLKTASKYVQQGKYQSAIEEYRQIAHADPADVTTLNTLGDLYVKVGLTSDAISCFMHIAEHYRVSGFYLKAIAMLKKVSKLDTGNIEVSLKLAGLYAQQKLIVDARHQYLSVAEHYIREGQTPQALEIYQKIADLDPENTAVQLKLAEAYVREGEIEKAYDTFLLAANELRRQGKEAEALPIYLRAIKAHPKGQAALSAAVNLHLDQGNTGAAIELIQNLLAERPNDAELLTLLARIYQSTNNLDEAEATIEKVLVCAPARYQYALDLASLYVRRSDVTGALRLYDRIIESLYEYHEAEKAANLLREIIAVEPQHLGVLTRLTAVYEHTHDDHLLIDTLNTLAEVALQKDSTPAAITALKRLLELEPDEIQHRRRLRELEGAPPEEMPVAQVSHYETSFETAPEQAAADFSDYSIEVTAETSNKFAETSSQDDQWSHWSISAVEAPAEATPDFGGFGETTAQPEENGFFDAALPSFEVTEPAQRAAQASFRDELESVDFYLTQGMLDVARYTLETIAESFPNHPEVNARFAQLSEAETRTDRTVISNERQRETAVAPPPIEVIVEKPVAVAPVSLPELTTGFSFQMDHEAGILAAPALPKPLPETEEATIFLVPPPQPAVSTSPSPLSLPSIFEAPQPTVELPQLPTVAATPPPAQSFDLLAGDEMGDLLDFLDEFKAESEQRQTTEDFETHYNLGLAYKEMDMFDEAIEEFQQAFKAILSDPMHTEYISCCNMLGFCFSQKGLPRLAVVWLKKALEAPGRGEEVYQALRYDLADAYAAMGSLTEAYETFAEVYAIDVQYRSVKTRMQELASQLGK